MGIIKRTTQLGQRDVEIGHKRVYTPNTLDRTLKSSGWEIVKREGIFLKPLSNEQMEIWPEQVLEQLLVVGQRIPHMCAHLYRLCSN